MIPEAVQERIKSVSLEINGRTLTLETGRLAEQAMGAVVVRYGDSMVLSTVVGDREPREDLPFFPLTVDYEERMSAAGKIPGGFPKREGRPTENAILAARLTDRPIRPLFPRGYRAEVQIMTTVLSADQENDPDILSVIGASAALALSPIPWDGPVGAIRMGLIDGEPVLNPTFAQLEQSRLDMVVAGTDDAIMMVEGQSHEVSEDEMLSAIGIAHQNIADIVELQRELQRMAGKEKWEFVPKAGNQQLRDDLTEFLGDRLREAVRNTDKVVRLEATDELQTAAISHFTTAEDGQEPRYRASEVKDYYEALLKSEVRNGILEDGIRPDGRSPKDIRPIWSDVGYLPRAHGSAIFTRGQTQVLTTVTLGSTSEEQRLDSISPATSKRYIHHYNFPPYSVGEVRRLRGASRRDIGHGNLAERALFMVIPEEDLSDYTMRLISEVVSSNGSTSMASVCGSSLALMDAGIRLKSHVAGIAMGLITGGENGSFAVLSDIQGVEDALGDMDFKVAGTENGVTAIQMDIKVKGITIEIMRQALEQANEGRQHILARMNETIAQPRAEKSAFAPQVITVMISSDKIGAVIGPGGKMIRAIQEETKSKIDIDDSGKVSIASTEPGGAQAAQQRVLALTQEFKVDRGQKFTGKVVSIMPYGAFVELAPGKDGLVHISELSDDPAVRVDKVEDVVNLNDQIEVMVTEVAPNGKVSLSRRAAVTGELPEPKQERPRGPRPGGDRGPRSEGERRFEERGPRPAGERRFDDRGPRRPQD
ncbi:MAG: Polyribonucleotide nucleotidyltransferase [uncultured Thermomicrobiales bacterium]|uniref:Polyribonucleotide nucleotidyltransferase n=1 Tax=uncultured Thermomicrobiales bacterium TaxID=1645740 RepID=A0A6J4UUU6_9BACT|nr:MAG: Polyribonucleotide nucleotidyltransferase [uncultured Thermomicrobiales bacterium]